MGGEGEKGYYFVSLKNLRTKQSQEQPRLNLNAKQEAVFMCCRSAPGLQLSEVKAGFVMHNLISEFVDLKRRA